LGLQKKEFLELIRNKIPFFIFAACSGGEIGRRTILRGWRLMGVRVRISFRAQNSSIQDTMQLIKSTLLISVLVTIGLGCKPPKDETPSPSTGPVLDKIVWYTDDGIQGTIWYNSDSSIRQIERKTDENYLQKISVANDSLYVLTYIDNQLFDEESNTFPIKNGKIYSIDNAVASYNSE
jgi:hypothetical protein